MRIRAFVYPAALFAALVCPVSASAQIREAVGIRAQGMGGAFVAVADDASGNWWNPAGIASGPLFSLTIERGETTLPGDFTPGGPASRTGVTGFAFGLPSLVLSYYRLRINEIAPLPPSTDEGALDREDSGISVIRALGVSQYGATFGQSLGSNVVVASTVRLLRGGVSRAEALDADLATANDLDVRTETKSALDLGILARFGPVRAGASVKYVNEPAFGDADDRIVLERQVRVGAAFVVDTADLLGRAIVSADADLTTAETIAGEVRYIATGAEVWFGQRQIGIRGGLAVNTAGNRAVSPTLGGSLAIGGGMRVDGAATFGSDEARKGWAIGLGLTF